MKTLLVICLLFIFGLILPPTSHAQSADSPRFSLEHEAEVIGVEWNSDGSQIMTWTQQGIYFWDGVEGRPLGQISSTEALALVEWRASAQRVLTSTFDKRLRVWDSSTLEALITLEGAIFVDWDARGNHLLTFEDGATVFRDLSGERLRFEGGANVARFAPSGETAIIGNQLVDVLTGASSPLAVEGMVISADWSPVGDQLLVATDARRFYLLDPFSGVILAEGRFEPPAGGAVAFQFVDGGALVAGQIGRSRVQLYRAEGGSFTLVQDVHADGFIVGLDWQGEAAAIAYVGDVARLLVVSASAGILSDFVPGGEFVDALWAPGGDYVLARYFSGSAVLFNPVTGAGLYELNFEQLPGIIWHPSDLQFLARVGNTVQLYDLRPYAAPIGTE